MKKGTATTSAAKKATVVAASSTTTKRKDEGSVAVSGSDVASTTKSTNTTTTNVPPKKTKYNNETTTTSTTNHTNGSSSLSSTTTTATVLNSSYDKKVQFTFGTLPSINSTTGTAINNNYKATLLLCKRYTLQQIVSEGNTLFNAMLNVHVSNTILQSMYNDCSTGSGTSVVSTYVDLNDPIDDKINTSNGTNQCYHHHKIYIIVVPDTVSRCNHSWSIHSITDAIKNAVGNSGSNCRIIYCGTNIQTCVGSLSCAVARAFSLYTRKSSSSSSKKVDNHDISTTTSIPTRVHISFMNVSDSGIEEYIPSQHKEHFIALCECIQLTAKLVDMTPEELTTTAYANECRSIAESLGKAVSFKEVVGSELDTLGYGGLYGIGKAATCPPRLVIMEYTPTTKYDESIALVGKGIVYDTGGLSLKSKDGMPGMKYDMGGSAGLLGAFIAAVKMKLSKRIMLLLCLAENAIGPIAVRNDDILTMYSGKTVEVNNTDAEGRLVLADGVSHASKHFDQCDIILDMATLTGAQLVAAGKTHAGILTNTIELEQRMINAGLRSGDLVVPLLYAPEILMKEFDSKVADMKNSVKDRGNAQASCAGHFIEAHLCPSYTGGWIHVDMAGPGDKDGRGTGYGVALILALLNAPGF